jgi:F0F1-type ATP synthase assembly protein I
MSPKGAREPSGFELIGLGVFLAASVVVPLVGGLSLDAALHTGPLFFFVGLLVGIVAAVSVVYTRFVRRYL